MNQPQGAGLFPSILASTVHDIKNSLGTLQDLLQQLAAIQSENGLEGCRRLEFEANRINHSLMQLLAIYKIDSHKFCLDEDEYAAADLLAETKAQQECQLALCDVALVVECDPELICYCDFQYVSNALGTVLNNARRYSRHSVKISAQAERGYVRFCIEDDGQGYPARLLSADLNNPTEMDWVSGNTGLGLYFAAVIAGFHKNRDRSGFISIDNDSSLGGARFSLYLP